MEKKLLRQYIELLEASYKVKPKKLDAEWHAIHASANVLLVRYRLYVKARKKRGKKWWDLKEWIELGKPDGC